MSVAKTTPVFVQLYSDKSLCRNPCTAMKKKSIAKANNTPIHARAVALYLIIWSGLNKLKGLQYLNNGLSLICDNICNTRNKEPIPAPRPIEYFISVKRQVNRKEIKGFLVSKIVK